MRRRQRSTGRPARPSGPAQVTARLTLPFLGEISGVWEPADAERQASWELYTQLATRVAVVELAPDEGFLREALTSLYSLFDITRDILKRYGPEVAPPLQPGHLSFGVLAVTAMNRVLRPLLSKWHPRLTAYESQRPAGTDPVAYEREWEHAAQLRAELAAVREALLSLAVTLQGVAGVGDLIRLEAPLPPQAPPPTTDE